MIGIDVIQHMIGFSDYHTLLGQVDFWQSGVWQWDTWSLDIWNQDWTHLAQTFDTDVFKGTRMWFDNFLKSGQIWALIIGFVIGFMVRSLSSYG